MRASSVSQIILDTLESDHVHLTAQQVYEKIIERLPAVNPSTVYRALDRLANEGLVSISDMGQGAAVYEKVSDEHHHHLICRSCGSIQTIDDGPIGSLSSRLEEEYKFHMVTNHLVLFGYCAGCQIKDRG